MKDDPVSYSFGLFQLDTNQRLLLRRGEPVPLTLKAIEILLVLVEAKGQVVSKDDLLRRVWPDAFVEEGNLATNVHLLRRALGKQPGKREYIETIPKRGYRFVGEVDRVAARPGASDPGAADPQSPLSAVSSNTRLFVLEKKQPDAEAGAAHPIDQSRASPASVAEAIPLRSVASLPKPLTVRATASSQGSRQRWALALAALLGVVAGVLILKLRHGPAPPPQIRMRQLTSFASEAAVTAAAISPDGRFLAYSNANGLFLDRIDTGETHGLSGLGPQVRISSIRWFPDGIRLLVAGFLAQATEWRLWAVSVLGTGEPVKLGDYPGGVGTPAGGVVSPDGSTIAFETLKDGISAIWKVGAGGGEPRQLLAANPGEALGTMAWTKDGRRLIFSRMLWDGPRNSGAIVSLDVNSGKNFTVLSASDLSGEEVTLPDGRIVYGELDVESIPASITADYWQIRTDDRAGRAIGRPSQITSWQEATGDASVSADGKRLVLTRAVRQHSVYFGDLSAGGTSLQKVRRLTLGEGRDDYPHAWSPDGRTVYFESSRNGSWDIFKQKQGQTSDEAVIEGADDEYYPGLSPDGAWLLYLARPRDWRESQPLTLMRVPIAGGLPQPVLRTSGYARFGFRFSCSRVPHGLCALAELQGGVVVFRSFDPASGYTPGGKEIAWIPFAPSDQLDWDLAPDGSELAWIKFDEREGRVHLLRLRPNPNRQGQFQTEASSDVVVIGWNGLHAINWTSDGKGWFVTSKRTASWALLHVDRQGRAQVLHRQFSTFAPWPVPSPDGRYLAFSEEETTSNVWMLENF